MDNPLLLIVQFHFRGVEKLNLIRHHEYQMLHLNMYAPLQNIRDAILGDLHPTELAMMGLLVLQPSIVRNLVDLFYMFHPHPLQVVDHLIFDETESDTK